ncbi:MAG TPA: hypothetical protein VFL76_04355 [Edaphocola sp.]|nr:hypothetical protein [Edaphocola sp.]
MSKEQDKKSWLWPVIIMALIIISIIQVTAFNINKTSKPERIFWIISLVVWCVAGVALAVGKLKRKNNN